MDKEFLKKQKEKLEKEKEKLEKELSSFSRESEKIKGDWITSYPKFDSGKLEEESDEVEEYGNLLSIGYVLEKELKKVKLALERIKRGKYGICQKCKKQISKERLKVYPQALYCKVCQRGR